MLWLELLKEDCRIVDPNLEHLLQEISEILAIFTTMVSKVRQDI